MFKTLVLDLPELTPLSLDQSSSSIHFPALQLTMWQEALWGPRRGACGVSFCVPQRSPGAVSSLASPEQLGPLRRVGLGHCSSGTPAQATDHELGSDPGFQESLATERGPPGPGEGGERGPDLLAHHGYRPGCERPSLGMAGSLPGAVDG